jgi:hypothetical protein
MAEDSFTLIPIQECVWFIAQWITWQSSPGNIARLIIIGSRIAGLRISLITSVGIPKARSVLMSHHHRLENEPYR